MLFSGSRGGGPRDVCFFCRLGSIRRWVPGMCVFSAGWGPSGDGFQGCMFAREGGLSVRCRQPNPTTTTSKANNLFSQSWQLTRKSQEHPQVVDLTKSFPSKQRSNRKTQALAAAPKALQLASPSERHISAPAERHRTEMALREDFHAAAKKLTSFSL